MGNQAPIFDSEDLTIDCPKCSHKLVEKIGLLRTSPKLTCVNCGTAIQFEASSLDKGLEEAQRAIDDFQRKLKSM